MEPVKRQPPKILFRQSVNISISDIGHIAAGQKQDEARCDDGGRRTQHAEQKADVVTNPRSNHQHSPQWMLEISLILHPTINIKMRRGAPPVYWPAIPTQARLQSVDIAYVLLSPFEPVLAMRDLLVQCSILMHYDWQIGESPVLSAFTYAPMLEGAEAVVVLLVRKYFANRLPPLIRL